MIFLLTPVSDLTFSVVYCVIATTSGRTMSEDCIEWDESVKAQNNWFLGVKMLFWTPHFSVLDSTFFVLDSTFWLDSTLKIDSGYPITLQSIGIVVSVTWWYHSFSNIQIFIHHNMIESTEQKEQQKSTQKRKKKIPIMAQVTQMYIQHFHMIDILQQTSYYVCQQQC